MENNKVVKTKIEDDILFHLDQLSIDLTRLKIDYNRDTAIIHAVNNLNERIEIITELYKRYDKPIFRALKNKINRLIVQNPNLLSISLIIRNTRCKDLNGKSEKFYLEI